MRPHIWLTFAGEAWLEVAVDDNGTLGISQIAGRTDLRSDTLSVGRVGMYEGITIQDIRSLLGSTAAGTAEECALLVRGTALLPEGEPPSKKAHRSSYEHQYSLLMEVFAKCRYFEKLLEAPAKLPQSAKELEDFLSLTPVLLPLSNPDTYNDLCLTGLVTFDTSEAARSLANFSETLLKCMKRPIPANEATSSIELYSLTGHFIRFLNDHAPRDGKLQGLELILDSSNPETSQSSSQPLQPPLRPDFQLFVKDCLILRWENTMDRGGLGEAVHETMSKLKAWSPLFYGTLPYVIGGCCARRQFRWLKLYLNGKEIVYEFISSTYNLNMLSDVVKFLHSTIRMHCLLQKLQKELDDPIRLRLYRKLERDYGGEITFYPDYVLKDIPTLGESYTMLESLYDSIVGSPYLVQREFMRKTGVRTKLALKPIGDPSAKPVGLKELENATHDLLHGLADLHKNGYTHRDLRWTNCIKVNVEGEWKWVIIDLEGAGTDNEEWVSHYLRGWDAGTLEDRDGKKIYTKGSDMYQLGKLIVEWIGSSMSGEKEHQVMSSRGKKMQKERIPTMQMLEDFCRKDCERCRKFGNKL